MLSESLLFGDVERRGTYRRRLALAAVAVIATATVMIAPVSATGAIDDPKGLVLQPSEVPDSFKLESNATRYLSNAAFAQRQTRIRQLVVRSGRVSGYQATYNERKENATKTIVSIVHLCRRAAGAQVLFSYAEAEQRRFNATRVKRGGRAYRHAQGFLSDESFIYWQRTRPYYTIVLWRSGRTVAVISSWGLGRQRSIELARAQERRIKKLTRG